MSAEPAVLSQNFGPLAERYDVIISDVWGVLHNGIAATEGADAALARFRKGGGVVVLVSNAPRPSRKVRQHLDSLGVSPEAFDAIVTSGDVTRQIVEQRAADPVYHLGPERDRSIFSGLPITFAPVEHAAYVVCSGLFDDDTETPEDYYELLGQIRARNLLLVCANPDIVVERGDQLVYCAGALAEHYEAIGGEVIYTGKPHRPIYEEALRQAEAKRGAPTPLTRVLAIGDSVRTDMAGARALGVDALFLTAGIHADELGGRDTPDTGKLAALLRQADLRPKAIMRQLAW